MGGGIGWQLACPELLLKGTWLNPSGDMAQGQAPPCPPRAHALQIPIHLRSRSSPKGCFPCSLPMPKTSSCGARFLLPQA